MSKLIFKEAQKETQIVQPKLSTFQTVVGAQSQRSKQALALVSTTAQVQRQTQRQSQQQTQRQLTQLKTSLKQIQLTRTLNPFQQPFGFRFKGRA